MLRTFIITLLSVMAICFTAYANDVDTCSVQVAVATPPVQLDENIAFNVTADLSARSITLSGGSAPQFIDRLPCSQTPYTISATRYSTPSNTPLKFTQAIGQCVLSSGQVFLNAPGNNVSVVFPQDFICNG